jgi:hypothetical protein
MSSKEYGLSHLTSINKLESPEYAIEWVREIKDHLAMVGYGDLLTRNKVQPSLRVGVTNLDQETLSVQDEDMEEQTRESSRSHQKPTGLQLQKHGREKRQRR